MLRSPAAASPSRRLLRLAVGGTAVLLAVLAPVAYYGYRRLVARNFAPIVEGLVYRSAQPAAADIREWARRHELGTVINLRGANPTAEYAAERVAAVLAGVDLIDIPWSAGGLPGAHRLRRFVEALETARRPLLIHCRDGADRTGVASVLAAMALGGESFRAAREQLSWRQLLFGEEPESIHGLLLQYERTCRERGQGTGGWNEFRRWALRDYHPGYYRLEIRAPGTLHAAPEEALAVEVTVVNRSQVTLPAATKRKFFALQVFMGDHEEYQMVHSLGPLSLLPLKDLPPGGEVTLLQALRAPRRPGRYEIHFDLVEERRLRFGCEGSPVPACTLVVEERAGS